MGPYRQAEPSFDFTAFLHTHLTDHVMYLARAGPHLRMDCLIQPWQLLYPEYFTRQAQHSCRSLWQEHWRRGNERILWVSVSTDLKFDAARDMEDVGAEAIPIAPKASTWKASSASSQDNQAENLTTHEC